MVMRFVVAEDDPLMCEVICAALESEWPDAQVIAAANGLEAAEAVDGAGGQIDALVVDIFMPVRDGVETLIALRKDFPGIPAVAITGGAKMPLDENPVIEVARHLGASSVLRKPFTRKELVSAVEAAMSRDGLAVSGAPCS